MNNVQVLYALLFAIGLGSSIFSVTLYLIWRRDRVFLAFGSYAFLVAVFLSIAFRMQMKEPMPLWMLSFQMIVSGAILVSFYEANRLILGGLRARIDYIAVISIGLMGLTIFFFTVFLPERVEVVFIPDRIGQIISFPRFRGFYLKEWPNLAPTIWVIAGWMLWTFRHGQFLYRARHRVEFRLSLPVVAFSVIAPINDFGVAVGWWGGVFISFFTFGLTATTASGWLLYQLYEHSQMLEDLTRNLEQKVEDRTRELKAANLHLEEVNALKNDFLAICSHDLKNLLVSVQGYGELLEYSLAEGASPDKLREYTGEIRGASQRMLDLIRDLLDSARLESGRTVLEMHESWVADVVTQAFSQYRREAERKGVRFSLFLDDNLPSLPLDRSKMQQAVANLLHNALKFTPEGGEIRCEVMRVGEGCRIKVTDTGPGIAKEDQSIVFDKFAMARKRRQDRSTKLGTGLGLSITKTFVELHGGRISLTSELGAGTIFEISLPGPPNAVPGDPT